MRAQARLGLTVTHPGEGEGIRLSYWRKVGLLARKELLIEARAHEFLSSMGVFGLLVLVLYSFSFEAGTEQLRAVLPGLLWLAYFFAGMLGLTRSFTAERRHGTLELLSLLPDDRSLIYLSKFLANLAFMFLMQLVLTPICFAFLGMHPSGGLAMLALVLLLGAIGFMAVGTLLAALTSGSRANEILLPLLLFPLLTPVIIGAVKLTGEIMQVGQVVDTAIWLPVLAAYDLIFLALPLILFEYLLEV